MKVVEENQREEGVKRKGEDEEEKKKCEEEQRKEIEDEEIKKRKRENGHKGKDAKTKSANVKELGGAIEGEVEKISIESNMPKVVRVSSHTNKSSRSPSKYFNMLSPTVPRGVLSTPSARSSQTFSALSSRLDMSITWIQLTPLI